MRWTAAALVAVSVVLGVAVSAHSGDVQDRVDDLLRSSGTLDLSRIGEDERAEIVAELRRRVALSEVFGRERERRREYVLLVDLGDRATLDGLLSDYERGGSRGRHIVAIFENSRQAKLIPLLGVYLGREESTDDVFRSDVAELPLSVEAGRLIQGLLMRCPEFGEDLRTWAQSLNVRDRQSLRESMREWWRENERYFQTGDYSAVSPPSSWVAPDSGQEEK